MINYIQTLSCTLDKNLSNLLNMIQQHILKNKDVWNAVPYYFAIVFLFNFSSLSFFSISIDAEFAAFRTNDFAGTVQGRWADFFTYFIINKTTVPYLPLLLFCFSMAFSYAFVLLSHGIRSSLATYLSFPIFCAFPTWKFLTEFSANMPTISLGLLTSSISIYLFRITVVDVILQNKIMMCRRFVFGILVQIFLIAIAIASYQSFMLLFSSYCCGLVILILLSNHNYNLSIFIRIFICLLFISVSSIILYSLIEYSFLNIFSLQLSYIQNFSRPELLFDNPFNVIVQVINDAIMVYSGNENQYGTSFTANAFLMFLAVPGIMFAKQNNNGFKNLLLIKFFIILLILIILFIPFGINFLYGGVIPYRVLVAVPYVAWLYSILALNNRLHIFRFLSIITALSVILQILAISSMVNATRYLTQQHDFMLASSIYERISAVNPDFDRNKTCHVDFYGAKEMQNAYPQLPHSTAGASFFQWDGGNANRITTFMKLIGYLNLQLLPTKERLKLIPLYEQMPIWPAPGSVKVVNEVTLVKLGNTAGFY